MNWESLIAERMAMHGDVLTLRVADPARRNKLEYNRKWNKAHPDVSRRTNKKWRKNHPDYEKTPERKAQHKAWAQSDAGKRSTSERGKRYRATEKGREACRRKSANYFARHKDDPAWREHRREVQRAWRAKNREKVAEINARYKAKQQKEAA